MVAEVFSGMIQGIEGQIVQIQADISNGLPNFYMTGYLSNEVKESKERVRTALHNIGIALPPKRISVNFAPADFRKCGTFFDLAVAVAILFAMNLIPETYVKNTLFIGELSLNGQIRPISGVLPIVVSAVKNGINRCIVAKENIEEAAFVDQMEVVSFQSLEELYSYLRHGYIVDRHSGEITEQKEADIRGMVSIDGEITDNGALNLGEWNQITDFSEVKGQSMAKRAMEIAAAGYHNLMLGGPPGVGKTMLASCISGIMPQMTKEEMIRIPLENHAISVIRQERTLIFPADFLFIIAANACPCGYYPMDKCRCTSRQILRYQNRISGPILDRMDLFVRCEEIGYDILTASSKEEASSSIQKRVSAAWVIQKERFAESSTIFNGRMTKSEVEQYCQLDAEGQRLMKKAYSAFSLTGRSYFKILKTARTIADLEQSPDIKARHLEEALYFRQKEKGNLNER